MTLNLQGLTAAPSQTCGAIRLVPLLRERPCEDVRLGIRRYDEGLGRVDLHDGTEYWGFIPHGLILSWSDEGTPVVASGGQVQKRDGTRWKCGPFALRSLDKLRRREGKKTLRFLPLHLAMEGFLALHFGGPEIAWDWYRRRTWHEGLGERSEDVVPGRWLSGLEEALRVFEIHEGQVGVLLFVAEALASAFVCPSAADYRLLHESLLSDFYGPLIGQYALWHDQTLDLDAKLDTSQVRNLTDLRTALTALRTRWAEFTETGLACDLIGREVQAPKSYQAGPLALSRFVTELDGRSPGHIGELLTRSDGEVLYLKTFRLSVDATKRAFLLSQVAAHQWNLDATAATLGSSTEQLALRLERAGFGGLLRPDVLAKARKAV